MDLSQYSDEQLMQFAGMGGAKPAADLSQYSDEDLMKAAGVQAKPGFIDRVAGDLTKRANEGADAIVAYRNGEQGLTQTGVQLLGKMGAGSVADIGGEAVKSAYTSLPDSAQKYIGDKASKAGNYIADTSIGKAGIEGARQLGEKYTEIAKNNPNAARTIESVADVASLLPAGKAVETVAQPMQSAGKAVIDAATPAKIYSATDLRDLASKTFQAADNQGGLLTPQMSDSFVADVNKILPQATRVKSMVGASPATKIIDELQSWKGTPITFEEADQLDKLLTKKMQASSAVDSLTGKLTDEGNDLQDIQHALRDTMDQGGNGFDTLSEARKLWAASMRQQSLENIVQRAYMTDNPQTAIRTGFKTLAGNPARLRGFTPDEVKAIKDAAQTGLMTGALKFMGSRIISSLAGAAGGAAGGGPLGAAIGAGVGAVAGTPFRMGANAIQAGKAKKVMRAISQRPAVQSAVTKP